MVVDHKDGNYKNAARSNKRTLCRRCHLRKHKEIAVKGGKARQSSR